MASIGILLFIFHIIYISVGSTGKLCHILTICITQGCLLLTKLFIPFIGFISVLGETEKEGQYGQSSLLECNIKISSVVSDPEIRLVSWKKADDVEPLLVFYRGETKSRPGYSFAEPSWNDKNLNVSLLISNTNIQDEGVYTCQVMTTSGGDTKNIFLKVTGRPSGLLAAVRANHFKSFQKFVL